MHADKSANLRISNLDRGFTDAEFQQAYLDIASISLSREFDAQMSVFRS